MPKYFNDGKIKEIVKRHNEIVYPLKFRQLYLVP